MSDEQPPLSLEQRVASLETRLEEIAKELAKVGRQQLDWDGINTQWRKLMLKDQDETFDRLKNLELFVFPNLARDINQLNNIIGDEPGPAFNSFDERPPPKKP